MPLSPRLMPLSLPWLVSAGLLAAIAWLLAGLIWSWTVPGYTFQAGTAGSTQLAAPGRPDSPAVADAPRLSGFARAAEFSPFGSTQLIDSQVIENAPETRLRLDLLGILTYGPNGGSAIIAAGGSDAEIYQVGETIGDALATLHSVHVDRVILERDGRLETLRLPRNEELRMGGSVAETDRRSSRASNSPPPDTASVSRSRWLADPERATNALRTQPVLRDGLLVGIRVTPTRNEREFERAGLREGDIITTVEGQQVRDIEDPDQLLSKLSDMDRVNITIERDGQALPLAIELTE
ncbi:type II secretion system protein GspC [Guyparkeria sp.]|uniref:type II secretion system protein GspC n=1 Tax=Guyparkeria sp. TaxID=2035736 RepID=UPI003970F279